MKKSNEKAQPASEVDDLGLMVTHAALTSIKTDGWIIDSGASSHMCNNRELFTDMKEIQPISIVMGNGYNLHATAVGNVQLTLKLVGGATKQCTLHDVLYVKDVAYNLFSVSKASGRGTTVEFDEEQCHIRNSSGEVVASGMCQGSLYYLTVVSNQAALTVGTQNDVWHRRYGHLNEQSLKKLVADGMVTGLQFDTSKILSFCKGCVEGKLHKSSFPKHSATRHEEVLGRIHSDVCGKMKNRSLGGAD